jgi:hypothetical protein
MGDILIISQRLRCRSIRSSLSQVPVTVWMDVAIVLLVRDCNASSPVGLFRHGSRRPFILSIHTLLFVLSTVGMWPLSRILATGHGSVCYAFVKIESWYSWPSVRLTVFCSLCI